eukprot:CAMPEP_0184866078 /NCGR_PEP_ID=MMETSP0580-20130426/20701_1 /TAXON_ID=1118495 /ORGANISM="Dactyliosolen fragilissimus" /LENGTH=879 /DNA_ID=CAMNT_0027365553 /DNA_START=462 /DNA_END=3101 /DNA_ORIENTATION=+
MKYIRTEKLSSLEGVDLSRIECSYSIAKRRGPAPGTARNASSESSKSKRKSTNIKEDSIKSKDVNGSSHQANSKRNVDFSDGFPLLSENEDMNNSDHTILGPESNSKKNKTQDQTFMHNTKSGDEFMNIMQFNNNNDQNLLQQQIRMLNTNDAVAPGLLNTNAITMGYGSYSQDMLMYLYHHLEQQQEQLEVKRHHSDSNECKTSVGLNSFNKSSSGDQSHNAFMSNGPEAHIPHSTTDKDNKYPIPSAIQQQLNLPKSASKHLYLLEKTSKEGNRLRAYYYLSIEALLCFPPIPTDEEYCEILNLENKNDGCKMTPHMFPSHDLAVLRAARLAEIALGALVNQEIPYALELSNACVTFLRLCVGKPIHPRCMCNAARAYFLLGLLRSYRGDIKRYFKYRRVCLTYLSQLEKDNMKKVEGFTSALLSAISFHDAWAYMLFNANDEDLPDIDDNLPPCSEIDPSSPPTPKSPLNPWEEKYGIRTDLCSIITEPGNQMWIQGPPPVFINNEAPPYCRSLDALACAIRSCCDQANDRARKLINSGSKYYQNNKRMNNTNNTVSDEHLMPFMNISLTNHAVMSNRDELCPRNLVLSAFALLRQHEVARQHTSSSFSSGRCRGQHLVVMAMDAFLEGGEDDEEEGFSDSQIQNLLSVCNSTIANPLVLYQCGPVYHIVTNAAMLLCHLLNALYAMFQQDNNSMKPVGDANPHDSKMEHLLFDEILDTFLSVRKLLESHREKLHPRIRCHSIPRPSHLFMTKTSLLSQKSNEFIDLGETIMCHCRGCQGFVLMACSPCVAAQRSLNAEKKRIDELAYYHIRNSNKIDVMELNDNADNTFNGQNLQDFCELENDFLSLEDLDHDLNVEYNINEEELLEFVGQMIAS